MSGINQPEYSARYHAWPCETLPKLSIFVCGYSYVVKGLSGVPDAVPCHNMLFSSTHFKTCLQGCAHQLSERATASSPCINISHKTLETNKNVVAEVCKRWRRCPDGL
jgi:hypothetical protein